MRAAGLAVTVPRRAAAPGRWPPAYRPISGRTSARTSSPFAGGLRAAVEEFAPRWRRTGGGCAPRAPAGGAHADDLPRAGCDYQRSLGLPVMANRGPGTATSRRYGAGSIRAATGSGPASAGGATAGGRHRRRGGVRGRPGRRSGDAGEARWWPRLRVGVHRAAGPTGQGAGAATARARQSQAARDSRVRRRPSGHLVPRAMGGGDRTTEGATGPPDRQARMLRAAADWCRSCTSTSWWRSGSAPSRHRTTRRSWSIGRPRWWWRPATTDTESADSGDRRGHQ